MKVLIVGDGKHEAGGALPKLISRLAGHDVDFDIEKVSRQGIHVYHGKGKGYFKKAIGWMIEAKRRKYDALILLIDEDGQADRSEQFDEAQLDAHSGILRALGVAIRTFDAWMLADNIALSHVLGCNVPTQPAPEHISTPKEKCLRLLTHSANEMSQTEMYAAIADCLDIAILANRCPNGFAPFADRVKSLGL